MKLNKNFINLKKHHPFLVLLFFLATSFIYLLLNKTPPPSDTCYYFVSAAKLASFDTLTDKLNFIFGYPIPPLLIILPFLPFKFIGVSLFSSQCVMIYCYIFTILAIYKYVLLASDKSKALTAMIIFGATPIVFGMSRAFMTDSLLTLTIAVSFLFLAKSKNFTNLKNTFLFAFFASLALLSKSTAPIFLVMPVIFTLRPRSFPYFFYAILLILSLTVPWYGNNFANSWVHFSATKNTATNFTTLLKNISSFSRIAFYIKIIINEVFSLPLFLLFIGAVFSLAKRNKTLALTLVTYIMFPAIIFLALSETILARYLMPLNIFISITTGIALRSAKTHKIVRIVCIFIYLLLSFTSSFNYFFINNVYTFEHTATNPHTAISYGNIGLNTKEPMPKEIKLFLEENKNTAIYFLTNETSPASSIIENIYLTFAIENNFIFYREGNMFTASIREQPFSFSQKNFTRPTANEIIIVLEGDKTYHSSLKEFNKSVGLNSFNDDKTKALTKFLESKNFYKKRITTSMYGKKIELYKSF